jgi:hypothetical protein
MATGAASLPPEEELSRWRRVPIPEAGLGGAAAAPPEPSSASVAPPQRRASRAIDLDQLGALADGSPVVVTTRTRWWVTLLVTALLIGTLAIGGVAVYRRLRTARHASEHAPPAATVRDITAATASIARTTAVATTTGSASGGAVLAGGASNLLAAGVAAALAPLLEQAIGGDPTPFTSVDIYPDHAVATARDPTDPTRTQQFTFQAGGVTADPPRQEAIDVSAALFTVADLDWNVLATLIAAASARAGRPEDSVTHVVVQRWGFDPTFPMRILVYLDGGTFVEAAADGRILAVH